MSLLTIFELILTILQVVFIVAVIIPAVNAMILKKSSIISVLFCLAMVSYLLSDLYWLAYDSLRPDTRMPFAANEFAECAMILLLATGLEKVLPDKKKISWEILFATCYIGANIALWILWSGEWMQDTVFGLPYIYFLWLLVRGIRSRNLLLVKERAMLIILAAVIVVLHFMCLWTDGMFYETINLSNTLMIFFVSTWIGLRCIQKNDMFLTFLFFLWTMLAMFSFSDIFYNMATLANTLAIPLMYKSVRKERVSDGIR